MERAIAQLTALGATVVEPPAGDGGLFTPFVKRLYPTLMDAAFARNDRERFGPLPSPTPQPFRFPR